MPNHGSILKNKGWSNFKIQCETKNTTGRQNSLSRMSELTTSKGCRKVSTWQKYLKPIVKGSYDQIGKVSEDGASNVTISWYHYEMHSKRWKEDCVNKNKFMVFQYIKSLYPTLHTLTLILMGGGGYNSPPSSILIANQLSTSNFDKDWILVYWSTFTIAKSWGRFVQ